MYKGTLKVGQLIDLLQPFRGNNDAVIIEDEVGQVFDVRGVRWDDRAKVLVVDVEEVY